MRTPSRQLWLAVCAALLIVGAGPVSADDAYRGNGQASVPWQQLSPEQQRVLGQFQHRWDRLPPQQQQSLLRGAQRWESQGAEKTVLLNFDGNKAKAQISGPYTMGLTGKKEAAIPLEIEKLEGKTLRLSVAQKTFTLAAGSGLTGFPWSFQEAR